MNIYLNLFGVIILIINILVFIVLCVRLVVYFLKRKPFLKRI